MTSGCQSFKRPTLDHALDETARRVPMRRKSPKAHQKDRPLQRTDVISTCRVSSIFLAACLWGKLWLYDIIRAVFYDIISGWWFGTWISFFHSVGNFIIPTDFHSIIFQRGWLKPPTSYDICAVGLRSELFCLFPGGKGWMLQMALFQAKFHRLETWTFGETLGFPVSF